MVIAVTTRQAGVHRSCQTGLVIGDRQDLILVETDRAFFYSELQKEIISMGRMETFSERCSSLAQLSIEAHPNT